MDASRTDDGWQEWNRLRTTIGCKLQTLFDVATQAVAQTPRSSSLVESLNSRRRSYVTLRRHVGGSYPSRLWFFLNYRRVMHSRRVEHHSKSPQGLMTGQGHLHWLTLPGLETLQLQRA